MDDFGYYIFALVVLVVGFLIVNKKIQRTNYSFMFSSCIQSGI